jgi:hypothetical protein
MEIVMSREKPALIRSYQKWICEKLSCFKGRKNGESGIVPAPDGSIDNQQREAKKGKA